MGILYILLGAAFGAIITYLRLQNTAMGGSEELAKLKQQDNSLDQRIKSGEEKHLRLQEEIKSLQQAFEQRTGELHRLEEELTAIKGHLQTPSAPVLQQETNSQIETPTGEINNDVEHLERQVKTLLTEKSSLEKEKFRLEEGHNAMVQRMKSLEIELKEKIAECAVLNTALSKEKQAHQSTIDQLEEQKASMKALGQKFNADFEKMGIKILEELESKHSSKKEH